MAESPSDQASSGTPADTRADAQASANTALLIEIRDAIGPATSDFFVRALAQAAERQLPLVIAAMDTPGGLDSAMRDMIKAILASPVPVAVYVSPSGARAASAGTYLLYASHIAAMAPATNLGAATPVQIGAPSSPSPSPSPSPGGQPPTGREGAGDGHTDAPKEKGAPAAHAPADADSAAQKPDDAAAPATGTAMERKAVNDAVAYIRGLAELRGRNAEWAEAAVRTAASLSASAALERRVIDVIATDVADLLRQIDGRTVKVSTGETTLATAGLVVERLEADWRTNLLAVITNPNVAYLLMLIGVYGLLLEGYNPGAILPGVVGAISLLLALYAFQVLSVNYAGLGLILLGLVLIIAEAFTPSFGALGLGGVIAFVVGSIILMDTDVPGFQIATGLIGGIATAGALLALLIATYYARSRKRPVVTGFDQMLDEPAVAMGDFEHSGPVRIRGEIWQAVTRLPVKHGERLRVLRIDGLTLHVEPESSRLLNAARS
ncbi:serine protease [Steroidobacter denitrificans]|uniref:Serine protease n=1 Tax=Steroidobacter denitrificans TaxID=465721 RepID=A0A127FDR8_STEDE|nr:serine protease [Steroidobacter denitrificans]